MMELQFWEFMIERERIRTRRAQGLPREEWTQDPIFREFSFTNVKREHDRTTTLLKKEFYDQNVIPNSSDSHPSTTTLLNAAIFRYHGTIQTARAIGWLHTWDEAQKNRIIRDNTIRLFDGDNVFTSAYIVPNCGMSAPKHEVVAAIIDGIWAEAPGILDTNLWEVACERMCRLWGVGSFMAKEVLLDYILATGWRPDDWTTWTPVGPGGRRGAGVVKYGIVRGIPEPEALQVCRDLYDMRDVAWPKDFVDLDLTDVQFQLCEFAKYMKVKLGIGKPKRAFRPTIDEITRLTKE